MKRPRKKNITLAQWIRMFKGGRKFYRLADLMKLGGLSYEAARKTAQRLTKKGLLVKLYTEFFGNSLAAYQMEEVANAVYPPSYISCETALFEHGVIDQAPFAVVSVSTRKGTRIRIGSQELIYHKIKPSLFWGFSGEKGYLLAEPEKALLDSWYLSSKKKFSFPLDELNWDQLNLAKLNLYAQKYPRNIRHSIESSVANVPT